MASKIFKAILALVFLVAFFVPLGVWMLSTPVSENDGIVYYEVRPGSSVFKIGDELHKRGLVRNGTFFARLVQLMEKDRSIKMGYYELRKNMSAFEIIEKLNDGSGLLFTVPEGKNIYEIAELLAEGGYVSESEFIAAAKNDKLLKRYNINAKSFEGYLFPSTYYISAISNEYRFIDAMVSKFEKEVRTDKLSRRLEEIGLTMQQMLTIASIIEKEAKVEGEKADVASVIYNRMKKDMRLEMCSTALYAKAREKGRALKSSDDFKLMKSDLKRRDPYNTYVYSGVPPAPICNPSKSSIIAALYPSKTDYLFFVSDNTGSHKFSKDYRTHMKYVRKYQRD